MRRWRAATRIGSCCGSRSTTRGLASLCDRQEAVFEAFQQADGTDDATIWRHWSRAHDLAPHRRNVGWTDVAAERAGPRHDVSLHDARDVIGDESHAIPGVHSEGRARRVGCAAHSPGRRQHRQSTSGRAVARKDGAPRQRGHDRTRGAGRDGNRRVRPGDPRRADAGTGRDRSHRDPAREGTRDAPASADHCDDGARDGRATANAALRAGMDGYVPKPIDPTGLAEEIQRVAGSATR